MKLSEVNAGEYFTCNDEVYYKRPSGYVMNCSGVATHRIFASLDGDPEVTIVSGEQAYKILKQKGVIL